MDNRSKRINTMMWLKTILALAFLPGIAQAAEPAIAYSPEFCEFSIAFPEEPYKTKRCEDEDTQQRCYDQISYTQVYELSSTVNFRVICNPVDEKVRETYSGDVMKRTLEAMTKGSVVQTFESTFREEDGYKQAGLVGEGQMGRTPTLYIAQLWIGDHSAFSVEAELIGEANDESDTLFSDILKTVHYKGDKKSAKEKKETEEESEGKPPAPAASEETADETP
jgi:hypothetical protein